jgi:methyl-accepting chemotaxis protein
MKLTLRLRLLIMVAVPLLGMLWVSAWNTVEKTRLSSEMGQLQGLVAVATRVGALAHELQKERGMSAGFIGSKGANFAGELPKQREASDKRRKELEDVLARFDAAHFGSQLTASVGQTSQKLGGLADKRQAVTALSIPGPEAIGYYTQTIGDLLKIPGQLAALSPDKDIARLASSYSALLQAKERAGIERATLSNVFGADRFAPEMLVRFVRNAAEQDQWFAIFHQYASETHDKFASEKIQGAAVDEVTATKKTALAKMNEESLGMNAKQWFAASTARIDLMKAVEDRLADDLTAAMGELKDTSTLIAWFYALSTIAAGLLVLWIAHLVARRIMAQIGGEPETAVEVAHAVADGRLDNNIVLQTNDNSSILATMQRMQAQLLERLTAERRVAAENLRIRIALDNVSTGVMIADNQRNIIYVNKSVHTVLKNAEAGIRQQLPNFSADNLVGQNIDAFHKNPAHQAKLLAEFTSAAVAKLTVGDRHMTVTANPVITAEGERVGAVAEWADRTQEVNAEAELKALLDAAVQGDFSKRIAQEGKQGFFLDMAGGMNQLMDTVVRALEDLVRVLNAMAHGDLSQKIDADYAGTLGQLKNDANATVEQLRDVVGQIKDATDAIDTAAKEIAAGNQDLSSRTEEQASSLEETASSMEQINSTVRNNADNAAKAAELANSSNGAAEKGGAMVGRVIETMSGIQTSSQKIGDIISVINSIAFQTNILALNAAVEAARAGEQGRGFAVVASEVRNLAQRSADAAKEIKTLIDESVGKVEGGVRLVHETGETITEVVDAFKQLATLVGGIAEASREQASGIEQVSNAVTQMDEVTQQNAALVEQAAAAAESLEEQARGLSQAVAMFRLDSDQQSNKPAVPHPGHSILPAPTFAAAPKDRPPAISAPKPDAKRLPPPQFDGDEDAWAEF